MEHRVRAIHFVLASTSFLWLLARVQAHWVVTIGAAAAGAGIGHVLGLCMWNRLRRQIDERNIAITYFEDSALYSLLVLLYLASLAPASMVRAGLLVARHPTAVDVILIGTSTACAGYTWVLFRRIRAHERRFGPLRLKRFYARSVVGPESLIGRSAHVVEACAPNGRVQVGAELWNARSLDGSPIAPGTHVFIRDVEGLRLIVGRRDGPTWVPGA